MKPGDAAGQRQDRLHVAGDRDEAERQGDDLEVLRPADERARPPRRSAHTARTRGRRTRRTRGAAPATATTSDGASPTRRAEHERREPILERARIARAGARTIASASRRPAPMPTALPMTSWRGRRGADQQLHDPARLLGDDARGDPHPVDDDRDEDQERRRRRRRSGGSRTPTASNGCEPPRPPPSARRTSNGGMLEADDRVRAEL